jgi:protein TonB
MTSALSQQVPDAPSVSSTTQLSGLMQRHSKSAFFIGGSIIAHVALLTFAAETPAAAPDYVEIPSELVVDISPEEPLEEELVPLGKLDETLPAEAPQERPLEVKTPVVREASPQSPKSAQTEATPEILGSEAEPLEDPSAETHTFNPYAQTNTDHFTRGIAPSLAKSSTPTETFGIETGSRKASAASAAALKAWYQSIRAQLAAGGLSSYPKRARKLGLSGSVKLSVRLSTEGQLVSVSVKSSSGAPILDQAALSGVQRVKNLPKPPQGAGATQLIVPIKFSLR